MSKDEDFIIKDGVLIKYVGSNNIVRIPNNVKIVNTNAFCNCDFLCEVFFPLSVKQIKEQAFVNCKMLKKVSFFAKELDCSSSLFKNCPSVEKITIRV